MAKQSIFERMTGLSEQLKHHAWLYHVKNEQEIDNSTYDEMEREFNGLCDEHPELAAKFDIHDKPVPISEPTGELLTTVKLTTPMLSLKKALGFKDVERFMAGFASDTAYVYEIKLDGLALEIKYVDGYFSQMVTRGAGMVGEDVTHALRLFRPGVIPSRIKTNIKEVYIRGEAFITIDDFNKYNEMVDDKKSNPRNAVSGWIRAQLGNQDEKVLNTLVFCAYWSSESFDCKTVEELRDKWGELGFTPAPLASLEAIKENVRGNTFPCDGIVIKVNSLAEQAKVGANNKFPRSAIAYKFPNEEATPFVEDVEWNTSRFGRVIPVAIYTPVKLGGVVCTRASLDNYGGFMEMGLSKGDKISVTRNNDVIPRVNHIIDPTYMANEPLLEAPTECPSCSALLEVKIGKKGSDLICNNVSGCPSQLVARCVNMANKFGFDIEGLGPMTIALLCERRDVGMPADIFRLNHGAKGLLTPTALLHIESARNQPLHRFIKGLGLPDIGVVLAKRIANCIAERGEFSTDSLSNLLQDVRFLTSVKGISSGIAMKVVGAFDSPTFEENFWALCELIKIDPTPLPNDDFKVCITGSFDQSRDDLVTRFAESGIELTDKLTKDCKYLIVGERPGKAKLLKRTELGITMLKASDYTSIDNLITSIKESRV